MVHDNIPVTPWQIHNEDYCPEQVYGNLEGPLEAGQIHGTLVCTVDGDDPLPIAQLIVRAVNNHTKLLEGCKAALREIRTERGERTDLANLLRAAISAATRQ